MTVLPSKGDGTILVPLGAFLEAVTPCYADTWDELFAWATGDPLENDIVEHLRARWRATGRFDEPVLVDENGELCNGRHRVTAAVLEAATHIAVTADDPTTNIGDTEIALRVLWPATTDGSTDESMEAHDDLLDHVFGVVRSFPIGDTWTECGGASMIRHELSMVYTWDPSDADTLADTLVARLAEFDVNVEVLYAGPDRYPIDPEEINQPAPTRISPTRLHRTPPPAQYRSKRPKGC